MRRLMGRIMYTLGFILSLLMLSGFGSAGICADNGLDPVSQAFVIATPTEGQVLPGIRSKGYDYYDVAVAGDGTVVAAWVFQKEGVPTGTGEGLEENPFPFSVSARRFAADGTPLTGVIDVSPAAADEDMNRNVGPRVAADAAGNFVVCWELRQDNGMGPRYIYARLFDAGGDPRSEGFPVSDAMNAKYQTEQAAVAMNAEGLFVVTWRGDGTGENLSDDCPILFKRFAGDGTALDDTPIRVNPNSRKIEVWWEPSVSVNDNGQFVIGWGDRIPYAIINLFQIRWLAQRFNADGAPQGDAKIIDRRFEHLYGLEPEQFVNLMGSNSTPAVAINPSGETAVSWFPNDDGVGPYYRFYRPSGVARGLASIVMEEGSGTQRVANTLDNDGTLTMAWRGVADWCPHYGILIAQSSGAVRDDPRPVEAGDCLDADVSDPAMDRNADGVTAVIWHNNQQLLGRVYQ